MPEERVETRVTKEQKAAYQKAADRDKRSLASWVRVTLDAAAEKER